jgi:hypothetical protein
MQEEQPIGSIVGAFIARDSDNNIAGYAIEPPNLYFHINNITRKNFFFFIPYYIHYI